MADYHAVLQRTLAGFSDPKPQLRTKLYERARSTIQKQLEGRTPPVTGEALEAELNKLEQAIVSIEASYDPAAAEDAAEAVPAAAAPVEATPAPVIEEPVQEPIPEPSPTPAPEPIPEPEPVAPEPAPVPSDPVLENAYGEAVAASPEQTVFDAAQELQIPVAPASEPVAEQAVHTPIEPDAADAEPQPAAPVEEAAPDPLDQWAKEFMNAQAEPVQAEATTFDPAPITEPSQFDSHQAAEAVQYAEPAAANSELSIPPAPGFSERAENGRKKGGFLKWLFMLILLGALGAAGYYGWTEREQLIERFGLAELFSDADNPIKPKPVKTISIKPEPASATEDEAPKPDVPKDENRLAPEGGEVLQPEASDSNPVVLPPSTTGTGETAEQPTETTEATGQPATLPVSQRAILYEEGATASENTVDSGRIVWSVVQEEPAAGEPKEPAIRGRVEIPSRNVVLIMTIKRNSDKALPASHLIELVFAVPDDFAGGGIGQINRFVLKESEQGRGEGLVAVPARIADGIFLIALNNLEQAVSTNEQLLQERDWIDIPMQYRTGRRALITIEKGVPGAAVFKEVFEAWKNK